MCANLFVDACFHLSWINTKSGTTESYVKSMSNFLATAKLFCKVIIPPYNHFEKRQQCLRFLLAPVLHQYLRLSVFHFSNSQRCIMTSDHGSMFPQRDVKQFYVSIGYSYYISSVFSPFLVLLLSHKSCFYSLDIKPFIIYICSLYILCKHICMYIFIYNI